jgi:chorismate-pyruvate lyase
LLSAVCGGLLDPGTLCASPVRPAELPPMSRRLLVHEDHMTVRLEQVYGCPVSLHVLQVLQEGDEYARRILLRRSDTQRVVEFGIVRVRMGSMPPAVRDEIVARQTPLGDVLIRHGVLRRIEVLAYYHFASESPTAAYFETPPPTGVYGRVGVIHCNGDPAIELLEVVRDA